jgi:hypothetical protein
MAVGGSLVATSVGDAIAEGWTVGAFVGVTGVIVLQARLASNRDRIGK